MGQRKHKKRQEEEEKEKIKTFKMMIDSIILNSAVKLKGTDLNNDLNIDLIKIKFIASFPVKILQILDTKCKEAGFNPDEKTAFISCFTTQLLFTGYTEELKQLVKRFTI